MADLAKGFRFYEKRKPRLGDYFLESLYADIDSLRLYAGIHPVYYGRFHRALSKRFHHATYYQVKERTAYVYAILDQRRDPAWIEMKLKELHE